MTMFPSNPMAPEELDGPLADATPTTAPAPAEPAPPKSELAKLLEKPNTPPPVAFANGDFKPDSMEGIQRMAKLFVESGLYPQLLTGCNSRDAMTARMTIALSTGAAIGLTYHAAASNLAMINNRLSLWGDSMVAAVRRRPECLGIDDMYDDKTETHICTGLRKHADGSTETCVRKFSKADATLAKLWGKAGPWTMYPKRMLQQRARALVLRDMFADMMYGLSVAEEMQDVEASERAGRESEAGSKLSALAGT